MKAGEAETWDCSILKEIRRNRSQIKARLCSTSISVGEWEELHSALYEFTRFEREAKKLLKPYRKDDVLCGHFVEYEEISPEMVDEVMTDEYCEEMLKNEKSGKGGWL